MIAVDTSTWIAFLEGSGAGDVQVLDTALQDRQVLMVPAVLTELLSDPELPASTAELFAQLPLMEVSAGYWQRTGILRSKAIATGRRARLGDALIAQSCIDHRVPLLTRDRDFQAFAKAVGFELLLRFDAV